MTDDLSSLSSDTSVCPKCGATWIGGEHYWSGTGKKGNELDLAGLVCNKLGDHQCINPLKGFDGGVTWEERATTLRKMEEELDDV